MYLLDNLNTIKLNEHFNEIFQKVILLSLMYIEDTKKRNYIEVITHLSNCHSFSNNDIFILFIDQIINPDIEKYV